MTLAHWGGSLVSPLSCLSQRYSNLSLLWSEMAFSRVLALRVGVLWHWHTGGSLVSPVSCSKSTILQSFTLMVAFRHWGWVSCDTGTLGGSLVSPLSCLSQRYSNLSLLWSEMAFSRVLALRWVSCDTGTLGGSLVSPLMVRNVYCWQVNDTPIFHSYGPKWLLAGYWHWGWVSCDTGTLGGEPGVSLCLVRVNDTPIFHS